MKTENWNERLKNKKINRDKHRKKEADRLKNNKRIYNFNQNSGIKHQYVFILQNGKIISIDQPFPDFKMLSCEDFRDEAEKYFKLLNVAGATFNEIKEVINLQKR